MASPATRVWSSSDLPAPVVPPTRTWGPSRARSMRRGPALVRPSTAVGPRDDDVQLSTTPAAESRSRPTARCASASPSEVGRVPVVAADSGSRRGARLLATDSSQAGVGRCGVTGPSAGSAGSVAAHVPAARVMTRAQRRGSSSRCRAVTTSACSGRPGSSRAATPGCVTGRTAVSRTTSTARAGDSPRSASTLVSRSASSRVTTAGRHGSSGHRWGRRPAQAHSAARAPGSVATTTARSRGECHVQAWASTAPTRARTSARSPVTPSTGSRGRSQTTGTSTQTGGGRPGCSPARSTISRVGWSADPQATRRWSGSPGRRSHSRGPRPETTSASRARSGCSRRRAACSRRRAAASSRSAASVAARWSAARRLRERSPWRRSPHHWPTTSTGDSSASSSIVGERSTAASRPESTRGARTAVSGSRGESRSTASTAAG